MITITTENKRFTLKTDSDQSDKLFNEIVCHLIGRKPSGGGAVMNAKRIAPGKTKATVANFKKTAILSDREGPDQNGTDQEGSDTASKYDGYKGLTLILLSFGRNRRNEDENG